MVQHNLQSQLSPVVEPYFLGFSAGTKLVKIGDNEWSLPEGGELIFADPPSTTIKKWTVPFDTLVRIVTTGLGVLKNDAHIKLGKRGLQENT